VNEPNPEKTIFAAARQLSPEDRAAYLDQACGDNGPLRRRVEALLNASEQSGALLEVSAAPTLRRTPAASIPLAEKPGDKVGRYKLLQQIGEGGCGVVYMAEQEEPVRRRVALKIIKLGMDTRNVIARFEAERQALAMMDHPNIAKVFDAGATETGRPYFVMELVRGMKITDYCDETRLSIRARLDLFMQVCQAIQHAHQKGIIHRDIKPSNILVTVNDGVPVTKVIDFGIAKAIGGQRLANKTVFTAFEQFIGTPAYMSPEQTLMTSLDIDTRSDIYALGVLLYELLTGKTPFETKELLAIGLDEMRRTIREKEPERPSTRLSTLPDNELTTTARSRGLDAPKLISQLRGDLDWIVMKCLEKDRARRYETANGLTADIQRHLGNEPVVACPPGNFYRFRKFVRRNKVAFATVSAVMISLIMGLAVSAILFFKEKAAHNRADEQAAIAQAVTDFLQNDLLSQAKTSTQAQEGIAVDPNMTVRQAVDRASARLKGRFAKQPLVEASIRMTLADIYDEMNEPGSSRPHAQRALELTERILGPRDPLTIAARMHLTDPNPQKNVALQEKTLDLAKAVLGSEDRKTLDCMNNLGQAYTRRDSLIRPFRC
jgi:serine/threonine protein kinase